MFTDKKILITGGAGFIGSHLAEKLLFESATVVCLDNYLSGRKSNEIAGVRYVEGNVADICNLFGSQEFDYIFHFGEYSRVEQSLEEPHVALSNIYKTFVALLEFWQVSGAKLIYSGSSTKFSDSGAGQHLSPYTAAKSLNTQLLVDFSKWYSLPYVIVYFHNVYGGRELRDGKYSTVIGKYKSLVEQGQSHLPVTRPGDQVRNFTHIKDILHGILLATKSGDGDGYVIGADEAFSILDVCKLFGCKPRFQPGSLANRMSGDLRSDKIKKLGWRQQNKLTEHIQNFLCEVHLKSNI